MPAPADLLVDREPARARPAAVLIPTARKRPSSLSAIPPDGRSAGGQRRAGFREEPEREHGRGRPDDDARRPQSDAGVRPSPDVANPSARTSIRSSPPVGDGDDREEHAVEPVALHDRDASPSTHAGATPSDSSARGWTSRRPRSGSIDDEGARRLGVRAVARSPRRGVPSGDAVADQTNAPGGIAPGPLSARACQPAPAASPAGPRRPRRPGRRGAGRGAGRPRSGPRPRRTGPEGEPRSRSPESRTRLERGGVARRGEQQEIRPGGAPSVGAAWPARAWVGLEGGSAPSGVAASGVGEPGSCVAAASRPARWGPRARTPRARGREARRGRVRAAVRGSSPGRAAGRGATWRFGGMRLIGGRRPR